MSIQASELTPFVGSRVAPIAANTPLEEDVARALRQLLAERRLLLFRQGTLSVEQQMHIVSAFGPLIVEDPSGNPWSVVSNFDKDCYVPRGSKNLVFHSDYQFTVYGPLQTISLYADVMDQPAPTRFANVVAPLARLPVALQAQMETLNVVQMLDLSRSFDETRRCRMSDRDPGVPESQYPHSVQPLIARHRVTGEPFINVSQLMTSHVEGWDDTASQTLFSEIESYLYRPENIYTHGWMDGDLVVWDNIGLHHGRDAVPAGARRSLRRVAANEIDVPTMMVNVHPDPTEFPTIQWNEDAAA